jgi:hypothetical protein
MRSMCSGQEEDLTSPELDDIGGSGEADYEPEAVSPSDAPEPAKPAGIARGAEVCNEQAQRLSP